MDVVEPRDAKTVTLGIDLSVRTLHSCQILILYIFLMFGLNDSLIYFQSLCRLFCLVVQNTVFLSGSFCHAYRVNDKALIAETAIYLRSNQYFTALKGVIILKI